MIERDLGSAYVCRPGNCPPKENWGVDFMCRIEPDVPCFRQSGHYLGLPLIPVHAVRGWRTV